MMAVALRCVCCPEELRQFCAAYFRFMWKNKALFTTIACFLYITLYIGIRTITSATKLPPYHFNKPLTSDAKGRIPLRAEPQPMTKKFKSSEIHFSFKKEDLNLSFKPLPSIGPDSATYDNVMQYPCRHTFYEQQHLGANDTEDIMCMPRPAYLPLYRNPCYRDAGNDRYHLGLIHCVPFFHVLGNDKCGTTDFHSRLTSHPLVLLNNGGIGKEIYYWCWLRYGLWMKGRVPTRRFRTYVNFFHVPTQHIINERIKTKVQMITGDGTPMDFWDFRGWQQDPQNQGLSEPVFLTPHAMRHMYYNPKFIVLMRNPVDRLYSDYIFLGYGFTPEKFAVDVPAAIALVRNCLRENTTRQCFFSDDMYHRLPMRIHISCYSVFLREWLSVFHRNHFLILRTEDYHNDTKGSLKKAFQFLGVDELSEEEMDEIVAEDIKHETMLKKKAGPMYPETRALLEEFFSRFNQDLAALLDDDRFLWKDSKPHS